MKIRTKRVVELSKAELAELKGVDDLLSDDSVYRMLPHFSDDMELSHVVEQLKKGIERINKANSFLPAYKKRLEEFTRHEDYSAVVQKIQDDAD